MKAALEANPDCMQQLMLPMLKAMQRVAKDHNQNPQAGILLAKVSAPRYDNFLLSTGSTAFLRLYGKYGVLLWLYREVPTEVEHGTGSWFMYHALNGKVAKAKFSNLLWF